MIMLTRCSVPLLAVLLLASARAGEPEGVEQATIEGHGGWKLAALYAAPAGKAEGGRPAVVLTHMLNRSKEDWLPLVPKLTAAGFAVVVYDMRGHGKSVDASGKGAAWAQFQAADWEAAERDVLKVRDWLLAAKKDSIDAQRVALAGASIGANLSLRALAADPALRGAVLLSAGLDYKGVRTEAPAGKLAAGQKLAVLATKEDYGGECAKAAEALAKAAGDKAFLKQVYAGAEHGTAMFGKVAGVEDQVVKALEKIAEPAKAPEGKDVKDALDRVL
jgi:pimeloyl-ACP methyl ester carboxylesterase